MPRYAVVLDACVLVPIALADTLLRIAEKDLYRPLWSERIMFEAKTAVEKVHPGVDVGKRFSDMHRAFEDAHVTGWESIESEIVLPDLDDRHVVAAAVYGRAHAIVTANVSDFPESVLEPLELEAVDPDTFLLDQLDLSPAAVLSVIKEQASYASRPPMTPQELAGLLSRAGVPGFADEILRRMPSVTKR